MSPRKATAAARRPLTHWVSWVSDAEAPLLIQRHNTQLAVCTVSQHCFVVMLCRAGISARVEFRLDQESRWMCRVLLWVLGVVVFCVVGGAAQLAVRFPTHNAPFCGRRGASESLQRRDGQATQGENGLSASQLTELRQCGGEHVRLGRVCIPG